MTTRSRLVSFFATVAVPVAILSTACSSGSRSMAQVTPPDIRIVQLSGQANAARFESGPLPINFRVIIKNNADDELTLKRISVESVGEGAYTLRAYTQSFNDKKVAARQTESVEFWAPAYSESTILGANGPVTIRGVAFFSSPSGSIQKVFVQQVNDQMGNRSGN